MLCIRFSSPASILRETIQGSTINDQTYRAEREETEAKRKKRDWNLLASCCDGEELVAVRMVAREVAKDDDGGGLWWRREAAERWRKAARVERRRGGWLGFGEIGRAHV